MSYHDKLVQLALQNRHDWRILRKAAGRNMKKIWFYTILSVWALHIGENWLALITTLLSIWSFFAVISCIIVSNKLKDLEENDSGFIILDKA